MLKSYQELSEDIDRKLKRLAEIVDEQKAAKEIMESLKELEDTIKVLRSTYK